MNKEHIAIDPYMLEEEWLMQPSLFARYAEEAREKLKERDQMKSRLEEIKAEVSKKIRKDPEKHGLAKATEGSLLEVVITNPEVKSINALYLASIDEARAAQNMVDNMEMKKKALEGLVSLYKADYFSIPNEGREPDSGKRFAPDKSDPDKGAEKVRSKLQKKSADKDPDDEEIERLDDIDPAAREVALDAISKRKARKEANNGKWPVGEMVINIPPRRIRRGRK